MLIANVLSVTGQQLPPPQPVLDREHYFSKSQKQRGGAIVATVTGSLLMVTSLIVAGVDVDGLFDSQDKDNTKLTGVLFFSGLSIAAVSIPLLISSKKNRNKAIKLSFNKNSFGIMKNEMVLQ